MGPALSLTRRLCSKERELVSAEFLRCDGGHYMRAWLHSATNTGAVLEIAQFRGCLPSAKAYFFKIKPNLVRMNILTTNFFSSAELYLILREPQR